VSGELEQARSTTRFESQSASSTEVFEELLPGGTGDSPRNSNATASPGMGSIEQPEGYTARLLAAKKAAQKKNSEEQR
jgi:hypothetical protein